MIMTLELLKSYRSKKEEIKELTYKLYHLDDMDDSLVGNSVVFDYRSGYPVPRSVVGVDRDKYYRLKNRWGSRREQLKKECLEVEEFVENISDSTTRRIFRKSFIEGETQEQISRELHISQSSISKKISIYLNWNKNNKNTCYNQN